MTALPNEKSPQQVVAGLLDALEKFPRTRSELMQLSGLTWQMTERLLMSLSAQFGTEVAFDKKTGRYKLLSRGKPAFDSRTE